MTTINEFCGRHAADSRPIHEVLAEWHAPSKAPAASWPLEHSVDDAIATLLVASDASSGSLLDQVPRELQNALANLMKADADSLQKVRAVLSNAIGDRAGGFLALNDPHVRGFISKIKGQIGEDIFRQHIGAAARLAPSGCQEAWDIAINRANGACEYVQVKLYRDARRVIETMLAVHEKVSQGLVDGIDGETVQTINFAVPADIFDRVQELMRARPELSSIELHAIPISSDHAASIVAEGLSNVGPGELAHFFGQLFCGALSAGSMHAIVNAFLWYKQAKGPSEAIADTAWSTAISTTGITAGLIAETLFHSIATASALGIGTRLVVSRVARSRWNAAKALCESVAKAESDIEFLRSLYSETLHDSQALSSSGV